jgi:hypothetical protein
MVIRDMGGRFNAHKPGGEGKESVVQSGFKLVQDGPCTLTGL